MRQDFTPRRSLDRRTGHITGALFCGLMLALLAAYTNHFHNAFHFDDFHTITQNPAIRSLANIPRFFSDGQAFSIRPSHYSYRPLVSASLALDYWLAKGLDAFWFHVSTFSWYAVQLVIMYLLFVNIMDRTLPGHEHRYAAMFAVACYGLHPVNAETVNYVIQRGDLYSTLGAVAGLAIYCCWPRGRSFGVYLLPVVLGALAKQSTLVFPGLLFFYWLLFEQDAQGDSTPGEFTWIRLRRAAMACLPAATVCVALAIFEIAMTPKTFVAGAASRTQYWLTQPIVALHYFKSFFLPTELTADTDRPLVANIFSEASVIGLAFLCVLVFAVWRSLRDRELRPVAFGLLWFLIALLPTSLIPLAEPENDHRMFFPFVGLVLAVTWAIQIFWARKQERWGTSLVGRSVLVAGCVCVLAACAYGTHLRNEVWRSEESLWKDVTEKSPHNGRGLMNYGLTQMSKGNAQVAYDYFERAKVYTPSYPTLEINLGIAAGLLRRDTEAEEHFHRAMTLAPNESDSYSFYGSWLRTRNRIPEAIAMLTRSAALNPADMNPRASLMAIYAQQFDWTNLKAQAGEVLRVVPNDPGAQRYMALAEHPPSNTQPIAQAAALQPVTPSTPEDYLSLSQADYQQGRYEDCVRAAKQALKLRPNYAEAYNNIAAGYQGMGRWDEAIAAAQEAIRLKPDFQLARNNLAYASMQKARMDTEVSAMRRPAP